jgi:hypothetical protein
LFRKSAITCLSSIPSNKILFPLWQTGNKGQLSFQSSNSECLSMMTALETFWTKKGNRVLNEQGCKVPIPPTTPPRLQCRGRIQRETWCMRPSARADSNFAFSQSQLQLEWDGWLIEWDGWLRSEMGG